MDANEIALDKHLNEIDRKYEFYNYLIEEINDDMIVLIESIRALQKKARDYYGYDFEEDINELLKEII